MEQAKLEEGPKLSPEEEACAAAKFLDEDKFWKRYAYEIHSIKMTTLRMLMIKCKIIKHALVDLFKQICEQ